VKTALADAARPAGAPLAGGPRSPGRVNWRGMLALGGREAARFRKLAGAFVLAPALFAVVFFTAFRYSLGEHWSSPAGLAMLDYFAPGLILMAVLFRTVEASALSMLSSKLEGTVADMLMAPLGALETVAALAVWGTIAGLITGSAVTLATLMVWPVGVRHLWAILVFAPGAAMLMALLGTLFGLISSRFEHLGAFFNFLLVPASFLSGLFSPIDAYPAAAKMAILANPVFYAIDGFRYGCLGISTLPPVLAAAVLWSFNALLWAALTLLFAKGWRLKS
jgi:ABC-2 type transport system permease protein